MSEDDIIDLIPIVFSPDGQNKYTIHRTIQFYPMPQDEGELPQYCWFLLASCELNGEINRCAEFLHYDRYSKNIGFLCSKFEKELEKLLIFSFTEVWHTTCRKPIKADYKDEDERE